MEMLGTIVWGIGLLVMVVGGLWMLIETFKSGIFWGIGCLLFGPLALIWLVTHWDDGKQPFLLNLGGIALYFVGIMMKGG